MVDPVMLMWFVPSFPDDTAVETCLPVFVRIKQKSVCVAPEDSLKVPFLMKSKRKYIQ